MSIWEKEERLFREWKSRHHELGKHFFSDGAVSEADYQSSSPKIAFILKEVNNPNGGDDDLRQFLLQKGGLPRTWNNVARWNYGIKELPSRCPWSFYEEITKDFRQEALKSIVAMNLKKSPGGPRAGADLWREARDDRNCIRKQYDIYDPDITIICGINLGDLFKEVVGHNENWMEWRRTSRTSIKRGRRHAGIRYYYSSADNDKFNKCVVEFFHPQSSRNHKILLCDLLDTVEEIGLPWREH